MNIKKEDPEKAKVDAIVEKAIDDTVNSMVKVVEEWSKNSSVVSCDTVISMLKAYSSK